MQFGDLRTDGRSAQSSGTDGTRLTTLESVRISCDSIRWRNMKYLISTFLGWWTFFSTTTNLTGAERAGAGKQDPPTNQRRAPSESWRRTAESRTGMNYFIQKCLTVTRRKHGPAAARCRVNNPYDAHYSLVTFDRLLKYHRCSHPWHVTECFKNPCHRPWSTDAAVR